MLTYDNKRLKLFDSGITIDENLPKWKNINLKDIDPDKRTISDQVGSPDDMPRIERIPDMDFNKFVKLSIPELNIKIKANRLDRHLVDELDRVQSTVAQNTGVFVLNDNTLNGMLKSPTPESGEKSGRKSIFNSIKNWFRSKRESKQLDNDAKKQATKGEDPDTYTLDVLEFFKLVKLTTNESTKAYVNRLSGYLQTLLDAQSMGQVALMEKLLTQLIINKYESVLYAEGFYRVITEQQAVKFVKEVEKGVQLVYISNFTRPIPTEVKEKYLKAVNLDIFDNFVVMHYDPDKKSFRLTQEQLRKKRDPILFGIIRGSNKLYYIADWVDEYCNLTLEQFVDTMHYTTKETSIDKNIDGLGSGR